MKPILFSTPMVKALLNAKPNAWPAEPIDPSRPCKSQTRRIMTPQPRDDRDYRYDGYDDDGCHYLEVVRDGEPTEIYVHVDKPPFREGDRLWVRETWLKLSETARDANGEKNYLYKADMPEYERQSWKWRPSIHMPRKAARLFLEVREIRAERLQDITEADALAEGVKNPCNSCNGCYEGYSCIEAFPVDAFKEIWSTLNSKDAWESNPWVWVCGFMRAEG